MFYDIMITYTNSDAADPGWGKIRIRVTSRIIFPRARKQFFGLKYCTSILWCGSGIFLNLGSRMEKFGSGIRYNYPGSSTLNIKSNFCDGKSDLDPDPHPQWANKLDPDPHLNRYVSSTLYVEIRKKLKIQRINEKATRFSELSEFATIKRIPDKETNFLL